MVRKKKGGAVVRRIRAALQEEPINISVIYEEANVRGLPDSLRAQCWLALLNISKDDIVFPQTGKHHVDEDIVEKDVNRSMWAWGKCEHAYQERTKYREQLSIIINSVLTRNPELHYYQGYHDVATVLLMVTENVQQAHTLLEKLSTTYFRESMNCNLDVIIQELDLMFKIIRIKDQELCNHVLSGMPDFQPFFAVSWVLTWFAHSIDEPRLLLRLYDFFLTSHPLMALYFSTALVLHDRDEILAKRSELSSMHGIMNGLSAKITGKSIESIIIEAKELFNEIPPSTILSNKIGLSPKTKLVDFSYEWIQGERKELLKANGQILESSSSSQIIVPSLVLTGLMVVGVTTFFLLKSKG